MREALQLNALCGPGLNCAPIKDTIEGLGEQRNVGCELDSIDVCIVITRRMFLCVLTY